MLEFYKKDDIRSIRPYQIIKALLGEDSIQIPSALKKLTLIKQFRLFLTTMFEPFLELAINEAWSSENVTVRILENNLASQPDDIKKFAYRSAGQQFEPQYIEKLYKGTAPPSIYYLYGRPSRTRSFALSEDDVLEANLLLHSSIYRPDELFNFLSQKRLIILGCNFPNWLARFFIALTSPDPKKPVIQPVFVIGDTICKTDDNLAEYLRRRDAHIVTGITIEEFINRLFEVWTETKTSDLEFLRYDNPFTNRSVFISYASENKIVAEKIYEELTSIGIPVWLDKNVLIPGEQWAKQIESNLQNCSVFLPLISKECLNVHENRFFKKEWALALKYYESYGALDFPILPVIIDDIQRDSVHLPEQFKALHWIEAPDGRITDDSLSFINQLYQIRRSK
jgi:hypothetical protein